MAFLKLSLYTKLVSQLPGIGMKGVQHHCLATCDFLKRLIYCIFIYRNMCLGVFALSARLKHTESEKASDPLGLESGMIVDPRN